MKINKISQERKKYLKNIRKNKVLVLVTQIVVLIGFLAIWEALARNNDGAYYSNNIMVVKVFS